MTNAKRFTITIDGVVLHCAVCESAEALEALLGGNRSATPAPVYSGGINLGSAPGPEALDWPPRIEPERPRGRPSFDAVLGEAAEALQLDATRPLAERVRLVLRHLAETRDASEIPGRRTVERYLADQPARQKSRHKSRQKPSRAKLPATGG